MTEKELLYHFPYRIEKQNNFRNFVKDHNALQKKHIPNYDGTNTQEFLYKKSGLSLDEIHDFEYLYENFHHWKEWYTNGRNIFSFSKELLLMLEKTDVDGITPDKFHLPYDILYISLKPLNLKIAKGRETVIEGVYVNHNIWNGMGENPEGYCDLSLYFVGDFKDVFLEHIQNVKSRLPYNIEGVEKFDETPIGSFWNIWLWFEKQEGRENVKQTVEHFLQGLREEIFTNGKSADEITDSDLDFYTSTTDLLANSIHLVVNCLLYLSQPAEKIDVKNEFPGGLPHNLNKKLSFVKTKREQSKIDRKIEDLGYTRIRYVGESFKKADSNAGSDIVIQSHWRRGHWRSQRFGEKLKHQRMVWIMPTIVNSSHGQPLKGHLYDVREDQ
ncbi:hypothetical protein GCM10022216_30410 [Sphingobacterium kyonggiense]|uniref:Uncharacterized protein n=1 Tax=Sphingobacterium kyonggiense TaxID=714075 RepID=A0ABP7Z2V4_9SPHI